MTRLLDLVEDRKNLSLADFVQTQPWPVLLHRPPDNHDSDLRGFKTGVTDPHASRMELAVGLATDADLELIHIRKRPDGIFQDRIGVGRTRNNDLVLPYPKVSKFHAYFTWSDSGEIYFLTDPGSTNGTFINGQRLKASDTQQIPERCVLSFGRYHFRFQMAQGLYEVLGQIVYGL